MATIHDVAQDAGVSPTTVSRYLNNRIELPASTSARIDAAIQKLDYRPNVLAKRLSTGKTEAIGLVTPEIREPFFAELASAVEDKADRQAIPSSWRRPGATGRAKSPPSTGCTTGMSTASS